MDTGDIKLPFGIRDGRLVHISQVPSGLACHCRCPACGSPLVARKGLERVEHFAHLGPSSPECGTALETALHQLAKTILAETSRLVLPELKIEETLAADPRDPIGLPALSRVQVLPEQTVGIQCAELEQCLGDVRPDVVVLTDQGERLLIEVAVTHFADHTKRQRLAQRGLAALEFDLSRLPRELPVEAIREALVGRTAPVRWLYHPQEVAIRAALRQQLQTDRDQQIQFWQQANEERVQANEERVVRREQELEQLQQRLLPVDPQQDWPPDLTALGRQIQAWLDGEERAGHPAGQNQRAVDSGLDNLLLRHFQVQDLEGLPAWLNHPVPGEIGFNCDRRLWQGGIWRVFLIPGLRFTVREVVDWCDRQGLLAAPLARLRHLHDRGHPQAVDLIVRYRQASPDLAVLNWFNSLIPSGRVRNINLRLWQGL